MKVSIFDFKTRKRVFLSNYGRENGWSIELNGKVLAKLSDYQCLDSDVDSYKFESVAGDTAIGTDLYSNDFWENNISELVYRNNGFNEIVVSAFPCGAGSVADGIKKNGRLLMKNLYLEMNESPFDGLLKAAVKRKLKT